METTNPKPPLQKIPVYRIKLVKDRRPLRLAEAALPDAEYAGRTMHALLGLTDREHFAALFLYGQHRVTGAHVIAVGGQHGIGTIEPRTVFGAAITACASAVVLGHNHPSGDPTPSPEDIATTAKLMAPAAHASSTTEVGKGAGEKQYKQFVQHLAAQFAEGHRFVDDVPVDALRDDDVE
jgi:DNA repair protein RadC